MKLRLVVEQAAGRGREQRVAAVPKFVALTVSEPPYAFGDDVAERLERAS